ncbi:hypothetical protein CSOJ01_03116 [Colletotrichum sojae]|uniref:Transposase n=1 Tax=Colletotrichum sojae TaxID=2175907 RepID=A0A8H6JN86_9PEZI|nr:hypothetical protein CSOJ01_03116 [Colletotrichum sojae]
MDLSNSSNSSSSHNRRPPDCHTKQLTDAERLRIRTLFFDGGLSKRAIANRTGFTFAQVRHALKQATAKPRPRRPQKLSKQQEEQLVEYVTSSQQGRLATFLQLSQVLFNAVFCECTIRSTLRRLGFKRYVARQKSVISKETRQMRLTWALEHINWTIDDWKKILWTDETWILGGHHRKPYVTRRFDEELDPTRIVQQPLQKDGWMFWGCFAGNKKGPGIVWDKDWGSITAQSYQEHVIPIIEGWIRLHQWEAGVRLVLMQDAARPHDAYSTLDELEDRGITLMEFPPYSPDLNPIEACWNWMKDYLQVNYGHIQQPPLADLYEWVKEAWDRLPDDLCLRLLDSMPQRCQAVIDVNGGHTKF